MIDLVGIRIRRARKYAGITREKLADLANVTLSHIIKLEAEDNDTPPSLSSLVAIAKALNVSTDHLLGLPSAAQEFEQLAKRKENIEQKIEYEKYPENLASIYRMIDALPEQMQTEIGITVERMYESYKTTLIAQERINHCVAKLRQNGLLDASSRVALGLNKTRGKQEDELPESTIYFMCALDANRIKIGFTANIEKRIKNLRTSSPHKLRLMRTIPGTKDDERRLHEQFAHLREHGEWFTDCDELRDFINQLPWT